MTPTLQQLQTELSGCLHLDELTRRLYATDASVYEELPTAVAIPRTESEIQSLIQFASKNKIGIIPRTAGTSLAGQVVGNGIVVDVSKHFTKILEINADEGWVSVQPGVIRNELNLELAKHGLLFGPETSTASRAMIGGMVGNNSSGSNSIVYGTTRENLLAVRGFLSDGSEANFGELTDAEFWERCADETSSLIPSIYRGVKELLGDEAIQSEIRREFPKPNIHRRNTGYAIDALIEMSPLRCGVTDDECHPAKLQPFNFCSLIAGSEGTLFFLTEIKLRCVPLPPPISGVLAAHFETIDQALHATQIAMTHRPDACELIDRLVLEGAARNLEQRQNSAFVVGDPGAILLIEIRADNQTDVLKKTNMIEQQLRTANLGYHFPVLFDAAAKQAWELRKAGLGVVANIPGDTKPVAVIEDTAVAVEDLPQFISDCNQILASKYGLQCVHYGHAGAGEIHLRPVLNLKTLEGNRQFREIAADIATLVKKYHGSLSGEHGDGRLRAEFLQQMIGPNNYELLRRMKELWDPHNIFNPNKIINAPPMNEQLRYLPGQATPNIPTVMDFSHEQGILRAAELCNGTGDCRKTHLTGGTMCPSYMATKNEADTTRARANLLRTVLTNPTDQQHPFNNVDLKQVLDLCLSCKGCKAECPSNVDVAKMKAEFLQGWYDANGVPRRAQRIANFASTMKVASAVPWLFNWLTSSRMTSSMVKRFAGFSTQRSIPRLQRTTLRKWFGKHTPHKNAGSRGRVILFCDEFTNYNDVPVGIATVELLEALGFAVDLPEHQESGRAAISKGLLRQAQSLAETNVLMLEPLVSGEVPLVGIEPSALLTFRDEYPVLVGAELRSQARSLAENSLLIDEFISNLIVSNQVSPGLFIDESKSIRLHGHCHQKALASMAATVRMLQLPKRYSVKLIPSGCCGMAGSFGFEAEHYELSMQIGELVLFPTVRAEAAEVLIAAPGTSCRHQIADGTGRVAQHPVEILRAALRP